MVVPDLNTVKSRILGLSLNQSLQIVVVDVAVSDGNVRRIVKEEGTGGTLIFPGLPAVINITVVNGKTSALKKS